MNFLPRGADAVLDIRKLEDYCLDPSHPRGRHKARVFDRALGVQRNGTSWLRQHLLEAARTTDAIELTGDSYGGRWRIDILLSRHGRQAVVRSLWLVDVDGGLPRFITCWVL